MRITGVGVNRAMKNLMAMKAAKEERRDRKEAVIMDIASKYGIGGLKSLFPGEDVSQPSKDIYKAPGVDSLEITQRELDEVPDTSIYLQSNKEINAMNTLKSQYKLDTTAISAFKANGDPDVFQRLLDNVQKKEAKFAEKGESLPKEYLQTVVNKSVMSNSTVSGKINIGKIEKYIGREMDDLLKQMLLQEETPRGNVLLGEVYYAKKVSLEDLDRFEKQALKSNLTRANSEKDDVINFLAKYRDETSPSYVAAKSWLTGKKVEIEEAIKKYNNNDVLSLAELYGTAYSQKLLEYYPNFKDAPINQAVLDASKKIITVPNQGVAGILIRDGFFKPGEILFGLENKQPIPVLSDMQFIDQGFYNFDYWKNGVGSQRLKDFRNLPEYNILLNMSE